MNQKSFEQRKLSFIEVYDELIKICQNIAKNIEIPCQWIFIYFVSKNWQINDFEDYVKKRQIYFPSQSQTSKIFISNKSLKCVICERNSKIMIRNICQHLFCYCCLKKYIWTFYSNRSANKTVLPLCLRFDQCSQVISHQIIGQVLQKKDVLIKYYKKCIADGFVKIQNEKKIQKL